jgi:hypothetical protein
VVNIELPSVLGYSISFKFMVYHSQFCYDSASLSNDCFHLISGVTPYLLDCSNFADLIYSKDDKVKVVIHCQPIGELNALA